MPIFDIRLPASVARALNLPISDPRRQQIRVLKKLLKKSRFTEFGQCFKFDEILLSRHPGKSFSSSFPLITITLFSTNGGVRRLMELLMFAGLV